MKRGFAGGCNLEPEVPRILSDGGFAIDRIETMCLLGWSKALSGAM